MHLDHRFRVRFPQRLDAPGLRTGLVVLHQPASREIHRVLRVQVLRDRAVLDGHETRPPIRCREGIQEHPRRSRMVWCRARPEDAVLGRDAPVADSGVVGRAARARAAQLLEHRLRLGIPLSRRVQQTGQRGDHLQIGPHPRRRSRRPPPEQDPALEVGHRAGLLGPLRDRKHHIGGRGRLGQEQVAYREEVQRAQPAPDPAGRRRGHRDVAAHHQQRPRAAGGPERVEQLERRASRPRDPGRVDAPSRRDMLAGGRVVDAAVAGQLICLLAVFAAALPVPLAGQAAVPAARGTRQAQREGKVDQRGDRVGALAVLLCPAGGEHHCPLGPRQQADRGALLGDRHPGDPLHPLGPVRGHHPAHRTESRSPRGDVRLVDVTPGDRDVQQPVRQRQVSPRRDLQVQRGTPGRRRLPRIDHDQRAAVVLLIGQPPRERRHRLSNIAACQQDGTGRGEIRQREGQPAVDAEGSRPGRSRRGHAEPAVIVDIRCTQRDPGELAQRISLLVGQAAAAEDRDAVRPVRRLHAADFGRHPVQRLIPAGGDQGSRPARPDQRHRQPTGRTEQLRRRPPLLAQTSPVRREIPDPHLQPPPARA